MFCSTVDGHRGPVYNAVDIRSVQSSRAMVHLLNRSQRTAKESGLQRISMPPTRMKNAVNPQREHRKFRRCQAPMVAQRWLAQYTGVGIIVLLLLAGFGLAFLKPVPILHAQALGETPLSTSPFPTATAILTTTAPVTVTVATTATPTVNPTFSTVSITATIRAKMTATALATRTATATATPEPTATPTPGPDDLLTMQIDSLIASMSVADRVGQLFVVTFQGSQVAANSEIAELIQEYRVGGVVLSPANGNFSNASGNDTPRQVAVLSNQLQALAYGRNLPADRALNPPAAQLAPPDNLSVDTIPQSALNLPLLIGVQQTGDDLPATRLRQGFTPIPPEMALGATWNPELVHQMGEIVGRELSAVGVNLLLGPNLDVLDQPRPDPVGSLGIYTFGGDAYWVGKLGSAYVEGVHSGSRERIATIANHFPGQGGSDRRPAEEVATIQKSLQELRRTELPPFASVTQRPSAILRTDGDPAATDGLMSSHIRYSSFQGSRERTPPISLATELGTILELEEFAPWRQGGGLMMSDALGVPAVRRYYDPTLQEFPRKRIALDAFLAGNDLLYLSRFSLNDRWEDELANIKEAIVFFRERYTSDPDFAARVDASLRRILRLKLRLYADKSGSATSHVSAGSVNVPLEKVLVREADLDQLSPEQQTEALAIVGQAAREAITVLYPDPRGATDLLPSAPQPDEKILIFTDSRPLQECDSCPTQPAIAADALASSMLRLYGPGATGQLTASQLESHTFQELNQLLNNSAQADDATALEAQINGADWLIFAMLDVNLETYGNSDAVKQFLRLRSDRLRGKRIVVLAFQAPYFLDSTEISKLTAYFGVYSKTQPYLEAGVRALFRAFPVTGAPPVNVPGTRFSNLIERLEPDPSRVIELRLLNEGVLTQETQNSEAPEEGVQADLAIGDVIEVEAGPILDLNGHPVPDGTLVNFRLIYEGEELALPTEPMPTHNGMARISVPLDRGGTLRISASSVRATVSTLILVSIQEERAQIATVVPTPTSQPTATATPTTAALALANGLNGQPLPDGTMPRVDVLTFAVALTTMIVVLALLLVVLLRVMPRQMLVYRLLWALAVGWLFYILYGLGLLPGSTWLQVSLYPWGIVPVVLIGMLLPLVWLQLRLE